MVDLQATPECPLSGVLAERQGNGTGPLPHPGDDRAPASSRSPHKLVADLNQFLRGWRPHYRWATRRCPCPPRQVRRGADGAVAVQAPRPTRSRSWLKLLIGSGNHLALERLVDHRLWTHRPCRPVRSVGKPYEGEPHARIDRELETGMCHGQGYRIWAPEGNLGDECRGLPLRPATAPAPDPTPLRQLGPEFDKISKYAVLCGSRCCRQAPSEGPGMGLRPGLPLANSLALIP
jgi:hypothetical protein